MWLIGLAGMLLFRFLLAGFSGLLRLIWAVFTTNLVFLLVFLGVFSWCFGFLQVWLRALYNGLAGEFVE